jgi:hypothetical protein
MDYKILYREKVTDDIIEQLPVNIHELKKMKITQLFEYYRLLRDHISRDYPILTKTRLRQTETLVLWSIQTIAMNLEMDYDHLKFEYGVLAQEHERISRLLEEKELERAI